MPAFEEALASSFNSKHVVATNSATSALHLACLALGLSPGDRIWTSPITFVASANCGRYCGAEVDFVDIDPDSALICLEALKRKLLQAADNGTLPKLIVPVHLAGTSCPMHELESLVRPYGIRIIEDASHAVGASYRGVPVGSCAHSDVSVFSFHPVKIITTAEGGAASTQDSFLADQMKLLRSHGITKDPELFELNPAGPWSYEQQSLGFNYRLTDLQAALGLSQLNRLDKIVAQRNKLFKRYEALLEGLPVQLLRILPIATPLFTLRLFVLRVVALFDTVLYLKALGRQVLACNCITHQYTYSLITAVRFPRRRFSASRGLCSLCDKPSIVPRSYYRRSEICCGYSNGVVS